MASALDEQLDELPELNDEWLDEGVHCKKKYRNEEKHACQVDLINEQIADAEKLNTLHDPVYPIHLSESAKIHYLYQVAQNTALVQKYSMAM